VSVICQKSFTLEVNAPAVHLISYWKFDEESASPTLADSVDSNDLTKQTPMNASTGVIGNSLIVSTGTLVGAKKTNATNIFYNGTNSWTVFGWVKPLAGFLSSGRIFYLPQKTAGGSFVQEFILYLDSSAGNPRLQFRGSDIPNPDIDVYSETMSIGDFHSFCFWLDVTDKLLRVQLDNGAVHVSGVAFGGGVAAKSDPSIFGRDGSAGFEIDETGYYNKALSQAERDQLFANPRAFLP